MRRQKPPKTKVTQRDVAQYAKVSQAAVSRVIAGKGSVAVDVRRRIELAAAALGYHPDPFARSLITGRSNIIAIVMANVVNPFYPIVLDALTEAIQRDGRQVLLFNAAHNQSIDDLMPSVLQYKVAGIIVTTASLSTKASKLCEAAGVPVVLFNRYSDNAGALAVTCDNRSGGLQAASLLLDAGCTRLAYIGGAPDSSTNRDRKQGFLEAASERGIADVAVREHAFSYDWGNEAVAEILRLEPDLEGLFCGDDAIAFGAMDALRHRFNKRVPEDVSVIGFDDVPQAGWSAYRLTTVRQPLDEMITRTLKLVAGGSEKSHKIHSVPGAMVIRDTVRRVE